MIISLLFSAINALAREGDALRPIRASWFFAPHLSRTHPCTILFGFEKI